MSVHVFFDSLYYFFFSTYNFAVSPSGSTPIESVIMMLLASLTLFYTRAICCRESSLIRSCNRRQIHIVLIRSCCVTRFCVELCRFHNLYIFFYPITTSSTIISTKPMAKPMVLRLLCWPLEASGISSSTTT